MKYFPMPDQGDLLPHLSLSLNNQSDMSSHREWPPDFVGLRGRNSVVVSLSSEEPSAKGVRKDQQCIIFCIVLPSRLLSLVCCLVMVASHLYDGLMVASHLCDGVREGVS